MSKTIIKIFTITLVIQFLILVLIGALTDSIESNAILAFIFYFYFTLLCLQILKTKLSAVTIFLINLGAIILLQSYTIYLYLLGQYTYAPILLIYFLGVISAYFYAQSKKSTKLLPFILSSCFLVFMVFQGWEPWRHYRNFGTFTGKVLYNLPIKFEAFDEQKNLTADNNFQNKIVLLDFWTTTCGVCFEKFPQLQTVFEKYRGDSSVMILAVNKPIEEDKPNQAFEMIREEGYSFPVVVTKDEDLAEKLGVKGYPTTFVINRNGQIVYKGDIEGAIKMVDELKSEK